MFLIFYTIVCVIYYINYISARILCSCIFFIAGYYNLKPYAMFVSYFTFHLLMISASLITSAIFIPLLTYMNKKYYSIRKKVLFSTPPHWRLCWFFIHSSKSAFLITQGVAAWSGTILDSASRLGGRSWEWGTWP